MSRLYASLQAWEARVAGRRRPVARRETGRPSARTGGSRGRSRRTPGARRRGTCEVPARWVRPGPAIEVRRDRHSWRRHRSRSRRRRSLWPARPVRRRLPGPRRRPPSAGDHGWAASPPSAGDHGSAAFRALVADLVSVASRRSLRLGLQAPPGPAAARPVRAVWPVPSLVYGTRVSAARAPPRPSWRPRRDPR